MQDKYTYTNMEASDDNNKLYLWDLTSIGNIRLEVTTSFNSSVKSV